MCKVRADPALVWVRPLIYATRVSCAAPPCRCLPPVPWPLATPAGAKAGTKGKGKHVDSKVAARKVALKAMGAVKVPHPPCCSAAAPIV